MGYHSDDVTDAYYDAKFKRERLGMDPDISCLYDSLDALKKRVAVLAQEVGALKKQVQQLSQ